MAPLDIDRLYFELEQFKAERSWYNLNLTRDGIAQLLADQSWYQLLKLGMRRYFDALLAAIFGAGVKSTERRLQIRLPPFIPTEKNSPAGPMAIAKGSCRNNAF